MLVLKGLVGVHKTVQLQLLQCYCSLKCRWLRAGSRLLAGALKRGGEELPCIRGQGQRPRVPGCNGSGTVEQERSRGASLCLRSVAAGRSHLEPEARVGDPEEPPGARGQGRKLGGATHAPGQGRRLGGATQEAVAVQAQEGLEELSHVEGRELRR